jgi:hypothetical protein
VELVRANAASRSTNTLLDLDQIRQA